MSVVLRGVDDHHTDLLVYNATQSAGEQYTTSKQITDAVVFYAKTSWRYLVGLVSHNIWNIASAFLVLLVNVTMVFKVMSNERILINVRMSVMARTMYNQDVNCKHIIMLREKA